jgi:hypothetical protein
MSPSVQLVRGLAYLLIDTLDACVLLEGNLLQNPVLVELAALVWRRATSITDAVMSIPTQLTEVCFSSYIETLDGTVRMERDRVEISQESEGPQVLIQCSRATKTGRRCRRVVKRSEGLMYDCGRHFEA